MCICGKPVLAREWEWKLCVCVRSISWVIATHTKNALCFVITCLGHMEKRRPLKKTTDMACSLDSSLFFFFVVFGLFSATVTNKFVEGNENCLCMLLWSGLFVSRIFSALQFRKLGSSYTDWNFVIYTQETCFKNKLLHIWDTFSRAACCISFFTF